MNITAGELTDRATARVAELTDVALTHAGCEPTDDERRLVALGANLGIACAISVLSPHYTVAPLPAEPVTDSRPPSCRCCTQPVWCTDVNRPDEWLHKIDEIGGWIKAHGFDPNDVCGTAVVEGRSGKELHLAVYDNCPEHGRYMDWATMQPTMRHCVVPLVVDPPDLGKPKPTPTPKPEPRIRDITLGE